MKSLNGAELADYIKERQAKQVRGLKQAWNLFPKLAIIQTVDSSVIDTYIRMKKRYAEDIGIEIQYHKVTEDEAMELVRKLNDDETIHGIIIQLPLQDPTRTDELVNAVAPEKDVDALGAKATPEPATPMAINWLLAGYNVELSGKNIVIIGNGRLVGAPLARMWHNSGYNVEVIDKPVEDLTLRLKKADVIVTATGNPSLITSEMLRPDTVVVDAATASENGKIVGDIAPDVRERHDLVITPEKGGVGPLTICALFDNVIRSTREVATLKDREQS